MTSLLIADAAGALAKGIEKQLGALYEITVCSDGDKLLKQVFEFAPDILFLDMSIPGADCFALLENLVATGKQTGVVALVSFASDYILARLASLNVQHIMTKPCQVNYAVSHIRQLDFLRQHPDMTGWSMENEAENILLDLGFNIGRCRYYALCHAVSYKYTHRECQVKELYFAVAEVQGTNPKQVEKAVRDAIHDAYRIGDPYLWRMYFNPRKNGGPPTNDEFIARIAECLRQKQRLKKPFLRKAE